MALKSNERELGAIGESIKHMGERMDDADESRSRLESRLESHANETTRKFAEVNSGIQEIKDVMNEIKGGWKATSVMVAVAGGLGAGGAFILKEIISGFK